MISTIRINSLSELVVKQLPPLAVSLGVAELCFKFGSFTLECIAFLGLWYILDHVYQRSVGRFYTR
jgi:hypothetical protein